MASRFPLALSGSFPARQAYLVTAMSRAGFELLRDTAEYVRYLTYDKALRDGKSPSAAREEAEAAFREFWKNADRRRSPR